MSRKSQTFSNLGAAVTKETLHEKVSLQRISYSMEEPDTATFVDGPSLVTNVELLLQAREKLRSESC